MKKTRKQTPQLLAHLLVLFIGIAMFFGKNVRFGGLLFAEQSSLSQESFTLVPPSNDSMSSSEAISQDSGSEQLDGSQEYQSQQMDDQIQKRQQFLQDIQSQIQAAQNDYFTIHHNVGDAQGKLTGVQEERVTLQNQIDILNEQIQNTVEITNNVLTQIQEKENEITAMKENIEIKNLEIENQKKLMADYLKVMYEQENSIDDTTTANDAVNIAKLLLSDQSPDEALKELHYFNILEQTGRDIYNKLQTLVQEQEQDQTSLEDSRNKFELLYNQLVDQKQTLEMQQQAKAQLLSETQGQETIYQQLIDQSSTEESQALDDINSLHNNLQFIQDKITQLGDSFNPADFQSVLTGATTNVYEYMKDNPDGAFQPIWPVSPSRGISAYFHDPSYLKAMGIPHEAIDIPTPQGTPIRAPADGVVYKTRDNGFGYSYIILAHSGGFMTLYGHVSDIMCKEGQKILQGQIIGLSGATPGTKGAGLLTTGPHLHFEVMKGGQHVDPLDYLPLDYLPLNSIPAKYLSRITGEQFGVQRTSGAGLTDIFDLSQETQQTPDSNVGS